MANIDRLNPPPNPFWGFVADMQDHPVFGGHRPRQAPPQARNAEPAAAAGASTTSNQPQQTDAEDPPEIDPTTLRQEGDHARDHGCRGRRRRGSGSDEEGDRRREWHGRRGWGRRGHWSGPIEHLAGNPFMAGSHIPTLPPLPFGPGAYGSHVHMSRGGHYHHGGPPHFHPHGPPHRHPRGPRGPSPPSPPAGNFDLGKFLSELGSRIGMDLSGAAEGLGLERFLPTATHPEVDYEPKADIFDRPGDFIIHISLPGAKKSDVGVDWDGEHSALHVAGVVHRPEVDETMLAQLVVDGRKRETGVFEKTIRLGTRRDPAAIDVAGIKAKMTDGILVVTVPKTEKQPQKRDVPIAKSATPSPARNEKHVMFDVDREMKDAEPEKEIQLVDLTKEQPEKAKGKEAEHEAERKSRESSATVEGEPEVEQEQLPAYNPVEHHDNSDWENFDSDEEGEFVKINVD